MATKLAQRKADAKVRTQKELERVVLIALQTLTVRLIKRAKTGYLSGQDAQGSLDDSFDELKTILTESLIGFHIAGMVSSVKLALPELAKKREFARPSQPITNAVKFLQRRSRIDPEYAESLRTRYFQRAAQSVESVREVVATRVEAVVQEAITLNLPTRQAANLLEQRLGDSLNPSSPAVFETLFRTESGIAYSAGQSAANSDPSIDSILWGYEYTTVGDDRVRANHAALDGVTLTKDDPRWDSITPPNGYNCRCQRIEVFFDGKVKEPPGSFAQEQKTGEPIITTPEPDAGFSFNPASIAPPVQGQELTRLVS